jgi:hypothetical protein
MENKPAGGFDLAGLTTASKIMLVSGILLLIDSFLSWQRVCIDLGDFGGGCAGVSAWGGSGGFAGVIMGILLIVLLIWEVVQLANMAGNIQIGIAPTKGSAYLGFAVVGFGVLKFVIVLFSSVKPSIFGWIGLVLLVILGYGSWMKYQEVEAGTMGSSSPPGDAGFSA